MRRWRTTPDEKDGNTRYSTTFLPSWVVTLVIEMVIELQEECRSSLKITLILDEYSTLCCCETVSNRQGERL